MDERACGPRETTGARPQRWGGDLGRGWWGVPSPGSRGLSPAAPVAPEPAGQNRHSAATAAVVRPLPAAARS